MIGEVVGGALVMLGGGIVTCSSVPLLQARRRWFEAGEIKAGLADAYSDTVAEPIPADMAALVATIP